MQGAGGCRIEMHGAGRCRVVMQGAGWCKEQMGERQGEGGYLVFEEHIAADLMR